MKKIAVLGSTGSVGSQALDVISNNRDRFEVYALSCEKRVGLLSEQIKKFAPKIAVTACESDAKELAAMHPGTEVLFGEEGLVQAAAGDCDTVLSALMGIRGLVPAYEAVMAGKNIALANKETLVAGGGIMTDAVKKRGVRLLPVDSEHSAIWQCLEGNSKGDVKRLILTASGGPFRGYSLDALKNVSIGQALSHPTWKMGSKITIDSATMMNKGLEIIEAKWLFDMPESKIDVVVHPESIVHSMVEYKDGAIIAQLGAADMRIPISYALGYPERIENKNPVYDFFGRRGGLTFEKPDEKTFTCMKLARQAIRDQESSYPVVLNAANEALVQLFLEGKIKFLDIQENIERMLERHRPEKNPGLGRILELDKITRIEVLNISGVKER